MSTTEMADACLLVSELVTNSISHAPVAAGSMVGVRATLTDGVLRVGVRDAGVGAAIAPRSPEDRGEGGYGLNLVQQIAARWGVERGTGTRVWFELAIAPRPRKPRPTWRDDLEPHMRPNTPRALLGLATSVLPYIALCVAMYLLAGTSPLLVLALSVPAAGFLLRTFMMFHDCAHGSLLPSRRANAWVGGALGLLVFSPFHSWRHAHAVHHATAADLDRRGVGDVLTLTVAEYRARSWRGRLGYRLFRNPVVMFGLGPVYALLLQPRFVSRSARPRVRRSVIRTDVALALGLGLLCAVAGWRDVLLVQGPATMLAGAAGVFLFYVQHQFEGTYWEDAGRWSFTDAALKGSSYLKLPPPLRFFTASIGLHHVHHLSAVIPNYNLQRAHDSSPLLRGVPQLSLRDAIRSVRLKLWDPARGRLVTFAEARGSRPAPAQPAFSNTSR